MREWCGRCYYFDWWHVPYCDTFDPIIHNVCIMFVANFKMLRKIIMKNLPCISKGKLVQMYMARCLSGIPFDLDVGNIFKIEDIENNGKTQS